ncbi:MAG TPA: hypothetical protein VFT22_23890 [Kofleriaceae bacterium]|nr:hypothetical protein [Kofleriaceae bacterium]
MLEHRRSVVNDLRGASRLAIDATTALTEVVEAMHGNISPIQGLIARPAPGDHARRRTGGVTGLVYQTVRGVTRVVGAGLHVALGPLALMTGEYASTPGREAVLAALNGVVGDHLARTGNPLAIEMSLRERGLPLKLDRARLAVAVPEAGRRVLVLIHGVVEGGAVCVKTGPVSSCRGRGAPPPATALRQGPTGHTRDVDGSAIPRCARWTAIRFSGSRLGFAPGVTSGPRISAGASAGTR